MKHKYIYIFTAFLDLSIFVLITAVPPFQYEIEFKMTDLDFDDDLLDETSITYIELTKLIRDAVRFNSQKYNIRLCNIFLLIICKGV